MRFLFFIALKRHTGLKKWILLLPFAGLAGESGRKTAPPAREGHFDPVPLPTGFADEPSLFPPVPLAPVLEMTSALLGALGD